MKFQVRATIQKPQQDLFRLICDPVYILPLIDPDVVSVVRTIDGPGGAGTRWVETIGSFGLKFRVDLLLTGTEPGRSADTAFESRVMAGTAKVACAPADGGGTDFSITMHATVRGIGRLLYPLARRDFIRRERKRVANFKRMVESGQLDPAMAEPV